MLALISPAKKLDFESETTMTAHSQPEFLDKANKLVSTARKLSRAKLAHSMNLSKNLAELNYQRFKDFNTPFDLGNAKQAALVFNGDTYVGLQAPTFDEKDFEFAQAHLRILSGLYGLLRPLDLIQPYRLEMGARFSPPRKKDLYDFWGPSLSDAILKDLETHQDKTVINLASNEYFKAIDKKKLNGHLITPVFKEVKDGETRIIGMFAKQARGMMARYMVQNRIQTPEGLKSFNLGGYKYQKNLSDDTQWVFTRKQPPPVGAKK
ncbi:MAG: peroxide stress protein YaaA [Rhodospirillales bacterium]|nr:peroxide stress protein YaaA [Rhodospirillales bacterium]